MSGWQWFALICSLIAIGLNLHVMIWRWRDRRTEERRARKQQAEIDAFNNNPERQAEYLRQHYPSGYRK